jgi:hypothetical protein
MQNVNHAEVCLVITRYTSFFKKWQWMPKMKILRYLKLHKGEVSLCLIKHHASTHMEYKGVKGQFHSLSTLTIDGGDWSASHKQPLYI